ncbi:MAG: hypothetical protein ACHREM_09490 [Polyangiales bacterium]
MKATAPAWMNDTYLGAPLDRHFQPIPGGGTTLFPGAPIQRTTSSDFRHDRSVIDDSFSFDAHVSAWGSLIGVEAGAASTSNYRFASDRAYDVHSVSSVDVRAKMLPPPPGAVWYAERIYWGHAYEAVVYGDAHAFNASVAADFKVFHGKVTEFAESRSLQSLLTGKLGAGAKKPGEIFATTPEELRPFFDETKVADVPDPVFVEYRSIPGSALPPRTTVDFVHPYQVEVRFRTIRVAYQVNAFKAHWYAKAFCFVNGKEQHLQNPIVTNGQEVTDGTILTVGSVMQFAVSPGDAIECGLDGTFSGMSRSGVIAKGTMPRVPITAAGTFQGSFPGSSGETVYTVDYDIVVTPPAP